MRVAPHPRPPADRSRWAVRRHPRSTTPTARPSRSPDPTWPGTRPVPVQMGYVFSAFSVVLRSAQIPGGGSSTATASNGSTPPPSPSGPLHPGPGSRRLLLLRPHRRGAAVRPTARRRPHRGGRSSPQCPDRRRVFPDPERGMASAFFNSAQYFATVLFTPLMAWIVHNFGWHHVFTSMGLLGSPSRWCGCASSTPEEPPVHESGGAGTTSRPAAARSRHGRAEPTSRAMPAGPLRSCSPTACCSASISASTASPCCDLLLPDVVPVYLVKERGLSISSRPPRCCRRSAASYGGILGA